MPHRKDAQITNSKTVLVMDFMVMEKSLIYESIAENRSTMTQMFSVFRVFLQLDSLSLKVRPGKHLALTRNLQECSTPEGFAKQAV